MNSGSRVTYQCISLRAYHGTVTKVSGSSVWVRWNGHLRDSEEYASNLALTDELWNPLPGQVQEWKGIRHESR